MSPLLRAAIASAIGGIIAVLVLREIDKGGFVG
jgi:hypothetical protein